MCSSISIETIRSKRSPSSSRLTSAVRTRTSTGSDRKSTRLNSSHTEIYTLSLHDALPILVAHVLEHLDRDDPVEALAELEPVDVCGEDAHVNRLRSEEHTSELQSHRDLHSFPTRRSSDLSCACARASRSRRSGRSARRARAG